MWGGVRQVGEPKGLPENINVSISETAKPLLRTDAKSKCDMDQGHLGFGKFMIPTPSQSSISIASDLTSSLSLHMSLFFRCRPSTEQVMHQANINRLA